MFYVVAVINEETGREEPVGFFSKEKAESNLLACIMVLPNHQRCGYGHTLLDVAYHLAHKEGRVGSPEQPLSDLGKALFLSYWKRRVVQFLSTWERPDITIEDIVRGTNITPDDVTEVLVELNLMTSKNNRDVTLQFKRSVIQNLDDALDERYRGRITTIQPSKLEYVPYPQQQRRVQL
ncbi:hypothetical protein KIPB_011175 [Kipferlia bialata]|uniref:MYST-type HAT domain-containing protein n=1 Tax=Kipferlia bialata TaxID=797122 RepID=A0A9K3D5Q2_9EUKA|nr:hypothetical protein KIPB_011175 [Kipferlia bialata]|eukprot:g11175.t1